MVIVMARDTACRCLAVIEKGRRPGGRCMAGIAICRCRKVGCRLALRFCVVVTGNAASERLCMIEARWLPGNNRMAGITAVRCGKMGW
jgi:hypothetical protein